MKTRTLKMAIVKVLQDKKDGLTPQEIYDTILKHALFNFQSKTPINVIKNEIRKSCEGIELKKSTQKRLFVKVNNGRYSTLVG